MKTKFAAPGENPSKLGSTAHLPVRQRYFSLIDTAQYLGLSEKTLYSWVEKGSIPAHKLGRVWRFDVQEIDDWIKNSR